MARLFEPWFRWILPDGSDGIVLAVPPLPADIITRVYHPDATVQERRARMIVAAPRMLELLKERAKPCVKSSCNDAWCMAARGIIVEVEGG